MHPYAEPRAEGSERERLVRFLRNVAVRAADRVEELPFGVALFNDALPSVWDLNSVWVDAVPPGLGAAKLAARLDRVQGTAGLTHRHAVVADEPGGRRVAPGLRELGFGTKRHLLMLQRRPPDREPDRSLAREVGEPEIRSLTEASLRRDPSGFPEEEIRQIAGQKAVAVRTGARFFAVELDGVVASGCDLYVDGEIAQIEAVMTLDEYRNRGLARAVVAAAIETARLAGARLVFLQAEEEDWPKELYRKLGFDVVGATHVFTRAPSRLRRDPARARPS